MSTNNGNIQNDTSKQINTNDSVYQNTYQHQNNSSPYSIYYTNQQGSQYDHNMNYYNNTPPQQYQQPVIAQNQNQQQIGNHQYLQNNAQLPTIQSQQIPQQIDPNSQYNQFFNQQTGQPGQNIPPQNYIQQQQIPQIQQQPLNYNQNQASSQFPHSTIYYSTGNSFTNDPQARILFEDYMKNERNPPEPYNSSIKRIRFMSNLGSFALLIYMFTQIANPVKSKWRLFGEYFGISFFISTVRFGLLTTEYKKAFDYVYVGKDKNLIRKEIDILAQNKLKII